MKKDIRYTYISEIDNTAWIVRDIREDYHFITDTKNPNYIFVSHDVFTNRELMQEFKYYKSQKENSSIYIFFPLECIAPDMNIFDYAICLDDKFQVDDRCMRMPTLKFQFPVEDIISKPMSKQYLSEKTKFCNFIYSNANAHPMRDDIFHKITEYKKIDSLGSHLNNCKNDSLRFATDWQGESIELKRPYKFSIAVENAKYKGYTSEKILTTFEAHSIPIYWGNPNIVRDFNPKSFINCHDYSNLDAVLQRIKEIDNNDDLWLDIMSQPRRTKEQIELYNSDVKNFNSYLKNIFNQDIQDAKRAPEGTWPTIYQDRFFHCYCQCYNFSKSILWGLIKIKKNGDRWKINIFGFIQIRYTTNKIRKKLDKQNKAT